MHASRILMATLGAAMFAGLSFQPAYAVAVPGQGTWETTLKARDINGDGVTDAYYDTTLDITWLADWNVNGSLDWYSATAWAAGLSVYGVAGWRLPNTVDDPSSLGYKPPADSSEMAHMYYVTLGNIGYPDAGYGLSNTANFVNMQSAKYWSGTTWAEYPSGAWDFDAGRGRNIIDGKDGDVYGPYYAVGVHAGDVAAVPEPKSAALLLAGLASLMLSRKRRELGAIGARNRVRSRTRPQHFRLTGFCDRTGEST